MKVIPENYLKLMTPEQRKALGQLTASEAIERGLRRLEREEQRIYTNWLVLHEREGDLVWNQSSTHKRTTHRVGWPDFSVHRKGKTLFIEMKAEGGQLTEEQREMGFRLEKQGFDYVICRSAKEAIEVTKRKLFHVEQKVSLGSGLKTQTTTGETLIGM